ncbi:MAG: hypothetical protein QNJ54_27835 [Prochloraceae cyanobacterium]|nr:hypothetical protein [Prochloraceae cyanobacterium]
MDYSVRVQSEIYKTLREIKFSIEREYGSSALSVQAIADAAFDKFIADWQNPELRSQLTAELIERRKVKRLRQGNPSTKPPKKRSRKIINYSP